MNTVTKSEGWDIYHVRAGHNGYEWATIAVKGWQATGIDRQPREIGEIRIHSSYGAWAYQWGHLGQPFKEWLAECDDRGYIAEKFMGGKAYVFDGQKTVRMLRGSLLERRQCGELSKEEARALWDEFNDAEDRLECSANDFVQCMHEIEGEVVMTKAVSRFMQEPWERLATSLDCQFEGFWREIMPVFQQALRQELLASHKQPA